MVHGCLRCPIICDPPLQLLLQGTQPLPFLRAAIVFCLFPLTVSIASEPMIVAHRGASGDAPENTMAAFRLAWQQGADAIEGDFHMTSDQQIVCIHDKTTERVATGQKNCSVAASTFGELRRLDVGSWKNPKFAGEQIPTLSEVLEIVPNGKKIVVEIKCGPEILPLLQQQLSDSALQPDQIVIICFNQEVITQARLRMPQYDANWLTKFDWEPESQQWLPTSQQVIKTLVRTGATGLGSKADLNVLNAEFAESLESAGKEFHVWTVNDAKPAKELASLGVDSITTNYPAKIREALMPQTAPK